MTLIKNWLHSDQNRTTKPWFRHLGKGEIRLIKPLRTLNNPSTTTPSPFFITALHASYIITEVIQFPFHYPVLIESFLPSGCKDHSEPISIRKLWSKGNYSIMCQELQTLHYESMFEGSSVEEFYIVFMIIYNGLVERFAPQRQAGEVPRWIRRPHRSLLRRRKNAWAEYIRIRNEIGRPHKTSIKAWETHTEVKSEYKNFSFNT